MPTPDRHAAALGSIVLMNVAAFGIAHGADIVRTPLAHNSDFPISAAVKATLTGMGLGMGDVVKMTVFMAADPTKDNKLNFPGLMAGYTKFFGTLDQPNKPARSAVQVAALVSPGALLEIEVIAAKPHDGAKKGKP